jgi:hypothetical protein
MAGWKSWDSGEQVLATEFQNYVQDQVVQVYAGTAARSSALGTAVTEGMVSYLNDINELQVYNGSAWAAITGGGGTATYATTAGTAVYATNAGTAVYATTSGTANYATTSGTADYATTSGTAVYATTAGTSVFATNAGTAVNLSGTVTTAQVTGTSIVLNGTAIPIGGTANVTGGGGTADFTNPMTVLGDLIVGGSAGVANRLGIGSADTYLYSNGTVASWNTLGTASYATTSGTAVYATTSGTAVNVSGTVSASQVSGTAIFLNGTAISVGGSATISASSLPTQTGNAGELLVTDGTAASWSNTVTANGTATPALIVKALPSQTGQLQRWVNSNNDVLISIGASNTAGIEIGRTDGTASTPFIDFHSGATATDYDSRIIASGGNGTSPGGSLELIAALVSVTGLLTAKPAEPATNTDTAGAVGYVGLPQVALSSGGTTLSKAHAGEHIYNTSAGTVTIPANASVPLEVGTTVVIINGNNTSAVNITSDTLRQAGTTNTGQRTIAAYGMATLVKVASTTWYISGNGVS